MTRLLSLDGEVVCVLDQKYHSNSSNTATKISYSMIQAVRVGSGINPECRGLNKFFDSERFTGPLQK
jgi:hypothetical protein